MLYEAACRSFFYFNEYIGVGVGIGIGAEFIIAAR